MAFDKLIGNEKIKSLLEKSISSKNILHSYLFTGIEGIGKKEFANEFLNKDIPYIRLLGIDKKGSEYLKEKRKEIEIPILSKFRGNSFSLLQYEKQ